MSDHQQSSRSPPSALLTLRLWHEPVREDVNEWRGEVKNLRTGETRYFRQWEELTKLIANMVGDLQ